MRAAVVAMLLCSSGCLLGELERIPCGSDDECPTNYFCDLVEDECLEASDQQGPPNVQFLGARTGSGVSLDVFVPVNELTRLTFVLENRGAVVAKNLRLELSPVSCVQVTTIEPPPADLAGGTSADVVMDVTAGTGCEDPITVDWFTFYSGRGSRGTFALFLDEDA